ncbi:Putative gustatory receptor 28b [Anthophora quadrimaculata]
MNYITVPSLYTMEYANKSSLTTLIEVFQGLTLLCLDYRGVRFPHRFHPVVERTGGIVHTLLNRVFDREIKTELERFSLQLLHRRIKFTANGYINLDNTFLHSMLGTVAMYMVVLIQFDVGSPSLEIPACNCTQN